MATRAAVAVANRSLYPYPTFHHLRSVTAAAHSPQDVGLLLMTSSSCFGLASFMQSQQRKAPRTLPAVWKVVQYLPFINWTVYGWRAFNQEPGKLWPAATDLVAMSFYASATLMFLSLGNMEVHALATSYLCFLTLQLDAALSVPLNMFKGADSLLGQQDSSHQVLEEVDNSSQVPSTSSASYSSAASLSSNVPTNTWQHEQDSAMVTWDSRFKLRQMSLPQLQQLARAHALRGFSKLRKAQLVAVLEDTLGLTQASYAGESSAVGPIAAAVPSEGGITPSTGLQTQPDFAAPLSSPEAPVSTASASKTRRSRRSREQRRVAEPIHLPA